MAGLDKIVKELAPKCPKCSHSLDLSGYVKELFKVIGDKLKSGERVKLNGFGYFYVFNMTERTIKSIDGTEKSVPSQKIARFKSSPKLKEWLNRNNI